MCCVCRWCNVPYALAMRQCSLHVVLLGSHGQCRSPLHRLCTVPELYPLMMVSFYQGDQVSRRIVCSPIGTPTKRTRCSQRVSSRRRPITRCQSDGSSRCIEHAARRHSTVRPRVRPGPRASESDHGGHASMSGLPSVLVVVAVIHTGSSCGD